MPRENMVNPTAGQHRPEVHGQRPEPRRPLNHRSPPPPEPWPDRVAIPVIARLIWSEQETWQAATARRWTADLVYITWPPVRTRDEWGSAWIPIGDVCRVIVRPRE